MSGSGGPKQPGDKRTRSSRRLSGAVAGAAAMLFGTKGTHPTKTTAGSAPTRGSEIKGTPQEEADSLYTKIKDILGKEKSISYFLSIKGLMSTGADLKTRLLHLLQLRDCLINLGQIILNNPGIASRIPQSEIDTYLPIVKQHIEFLSKDVGDPVLDFWIRYGEAVMNVKSESEARNVDYNSIEVDENGSFKSSDLVPPRRYKSPAVIVVYLGRRMYERVATEEIFREAQDILGAYNKLFSAAITQFNKPGDALHPSTLSSWKQGMIACDAGIKALGEKAEEAQRRESSNPDLG